MSGDGSLAAVSLDTVERPRWAPQWLPQSIIEITRRPYVQLFLMFGFYALHMFVLSRHGFKVKNPLSMMRGKESTTSVGYDAISGAVVSLAALWWRIWVKKDRLAERSQDVLREESESVPWKVPREVRKNIPQTVVGVLVLAFVLSGYGAVLVEQVMFLLAGYGVPLTVATTRAWKVLLGHWMWVYMAIRMLRRSLKPFFPEKGTWLRWKWKSNWLWWAVGGYYISALVFILADALNHFVLPAAMFDRETVVTRLIHPEDKDPWAMAIGSIAPCMSAPIFEEVLYRGFLLPALTCYFPMWAALPVSSVLFAICHMNPTAMIPLSVLGLLWALIYKRSGNLLTTILIHAMWNTRVFLGSFLTLGQFKSFD